MAAVTVAEMIEQAPPALRSQLVEARTVRRLREGRLGAQMYHVQFGGRRDPHRRAFYLKIAEHDESIHDLEAERQHLRWIEELLPAPRVHFYDVHDGEVYLMITEVEGLPSNHGRFGPHPRRTIELLAATLQAIVEIDIEECPFGSTIDQELVAIEERLELGLIDREAFANDEEGRTPREIYERLVRDREYIDAHSFTHGDLCMQNIIFTRSGDALAGIIDWGTAGIGDVHRDLSALCWSIDDNLGAEMVERFLRSWGGSVDPFRLGYFSDLDFFL